MSLLWNKIRKTYSPCLVSVVHLAYFVVVFFLGGGGGGLRCLLKLSFDKVKAGQSCWKDRNEATGGGGGERVMFKCKFLTVQWSGKSQLSR